jgi:hypothetical protein
MAALSSTSAWAWAYEQYRMPQDLSGCATAQRAVLSNGTAELLMDRRTAAENRSKVQALLMGEETADPILQREFEQEDPYRAFLRHTHTKCRGAASGGFGPRLGLDRRR